MIQLRPYQTDFVAALRSAMRKNRRVLGVAATGSGKTVVFTHIVNSAVARGKRVVICAHRQEILMQISLALGQFGVRHGWIMPGRTPTCDCVQLAMIQTLMRRVEKILEPDLLVIDEAHHVASGCYEKLLSRWSSFVLGVTATPERLDGKGLSSAFDEMILGPQTAWLVENNYLSQYTYLAPPEAADLSGIKTRMGDFAIDQLANALDKATITGDLIQHYQKYLNGKSAVTFCVNIAHAEHVAAQFNAAGIASASIDGRTERGERFRLLEALGTGELKNLTSCDLIGEGVDVPSVNGAILARPTKSLALHLQQVGRVLRIKPDGSRAIILDHVGNVRRHGLPDLPRPWSLDGTGKKKTEYPVKTCETCFRAFHAVGNWRDEAECGLPDAQSGCVLNPEKSDDTPSIREIAHRDGELSVVTDSPSWAGGISIPRASGAEFKALLAKAETREQLKEIAKLRGYHHRWVNHIMASRAGRRAA